MTPYALSTTDLDGYPDVRHVLLSAFDGAAFYFNTDVRSHKTAQLESDPRAALALVWPDIGRQLVVQGDVHRVSDEEAASVFQQRSRYLQLLAWVNDDQTARMPLAEHRDAWERFAEAHPRGALLLAPPSWCGYKIAPRRMTFWRGDPDGPSNRLEYRYIASGIGRSIDCRVIGLAEGPGVGILRGFGECSWPAGAKWRR